MKDNNATNTAREHFLKHPARIDLLINSAEAFPNFVIVDDKCNITFINKIYCSLLGVKQEEAIGQPVTAIIPGTLMPEIVATGRTDNWSVMTLFDHSKGKDVNVVCVRRPLWDGDKIVGAVAVTTFDDVDEIAELTLEINELRKKNQEYKKALEEAAHTNSALAKIVGHSPAITRVKKTINDYADSNLSILITGETGVGKEVFASAIHDMSSRRNQPFVKINCAAIPRELLESELFGYEPGAFTGAKRTGKKGLFEIANHGTVLLDEIGEMPLALQSKLLRALQESEIKRVGGTDTIPIDIRLISSTNRNLFDMIQDKRFRVDLFYRINTVEIDIPPLRERLEDIDELSDFFINQINEDSGINTLGIDSNVSDAFKQYDWPGNVRELKHILERLSYVNQNSYITINDCDFFLERVITSNQDTSRREISSDEEKMHWAEKMPRDSTLDGRRETYLGSAPYSVRSFKDQKESAEKTAILTALRDSGGNKAEAARLLGIDRSLLYYKLKKYRIEL